MTASLAAAEPDVMPFEAVVERIDGRVAVFVETYFYPRPLHKPLCPRD
jgi:hypothetical protein